MRTLKRRRLESRTDYRKRLELLKSGKARLVVRKTNRYIIAQVVVSDVAQDKVIAYVNSKQLLTKGVTADLEGSLKSKAAAYLTGFALGNLVKSKIKDAIVDTGMNRNIHKSRLYAVVAGFIAAGISVPHSAEAIPTVEEVKASGKLSKTFDKIKEKL